MEKVKTVVCVGDCCLDEWIRCTVSRLNPEGPVPLLNRERSDKTLGMAGLVASMCKALGAEVRLVTAGSHIAPYVDAAGLNTSYLVPSNNRTIKKTRFMVRSAGRTYQHAFRVDDERIPERSADVDRALVSAFERALDGADAVIVSDYGKGCLNSYVLRDIMAPVPGGGMPFLVDPFRGCDSWRRYCGATVIKANRHEATGAGFRWRMRPLPDKRCVTEPLAAGTLDDIGVDSVVVTLDADGFVLVDKDSEIGHGAASPHSIADVVGAGDEFISAMAVAMARGWSIEDAALLGNKAAGIQVGRAGCVPVTVHDLFGSAGIDGFLAGGVIHGTV